MKRSRVGLGSPSCSARGTIEASAASILTRLGRPRILVFLGLFFIFGYILTVSSKTSQQTIVDDSNNQLNVRTDIPILN